MAQIAGLKDFRQEGPPADIGTFQMPCSVLVFQFTFSGTTRTVSIRAGVRGWILVGNGTDFATVMNLSITYLMALPQLGGMVSVSQGLHQVTIPILIRGPIAIIGAGLNSTEFKMANGANCNMFEFTGATTDLFFTLRDITCSGNKANNASGSGLHVVPAGAGVFWDARVQNVFFNDFKQRGIYTTMFWGWRVEDSLVEDCDDNGIEINGITGGGWIINVLVLRAGLSGLVFDGGAYQILCSLVLSSENQRHGFFVNSSQSTFLGCTSNKNSLAANNT